MGTGCTQGALAPMRRTFLGVRTGIQIFCSQESGGCGAGGPCVQMASYSGRPDLLWTSPQIPQLSCCDPQTIIQTTAGWERTRGDSRVGYIKMFWDGSQPCGFGSALALPSKPSYPLAAQHSFKGQVADAGGSGGGMVGSQ